MPAGSFDNSRIRIDRRILDRLRRGLPSEFEDVLDVAAHNIESKAKDRVPVDTGATKNSIIVTKPRRLQRRIGPSTQYAPYLELGTHRMPARPFLIPALMSEKPKLESAAVQMIKRLGQ